MIDLTTAVTAILLVFYLYLLARWQHVKRPWMYLVGAVGIALAVFARFFGAGTAMRILNTLGALIAFKAAVGACYGGKLRAFRRSVGLGFSVLFVATTFGLDPLDPLLSGLDDIGDLHFLAFPELPGDRCKLPAPRHQKRHLILALQGFDDDGKIFALANLPFREAHEAATDRRTFAAVLAQ